jgi:hypothetical protein
LIELLPSVMSSSQTEENADFDPLLLELDVLLEKAKAVRTEDQAEEQDSDVESLSSEGADAAGDGGRIIQSLKIVDNLPHGFVTVNGKFFETSISPSVNRPKLSIVDIPGFRPSSQLYPNYF